MKPTTIDGYNIIFGTDQKGVLPIRARKEQGPLGEQHVVEFELDEGELETLQAGGKVQLTIVGTGWPPVLLGVGRGGLR